LEKDYGSYPVAVYGRERVDTVQTTWRWRRRWRWRYEGIFGRPEEAFDVGVSQRTSLEAKVLHIRLLPSLSSRW